MASSPRAKKAEELQAERKAADAEREVGQDDNAPQTVAEVEKLITDLGSRVRAAEQGLIDATKEKKASKAESMTEFMRQAEAGVITPENFNHWFLMWRYAAPVPTQVDRKHAGEMSRFKKAVISGSVAMRNGTTFTPVADTVVKLAGDMLAARKSDKSKPEPRQADLALYNVMNEVERKGRMLTEAELVEAIKKPVAAAAPVVSPVVAIKSSIDSLMEGAPIDWKAKLREARAIIENFGDVLAAKAEAEKAEAAEAAEAA